MTLQFREDGMFRVLQMADIQDGPQVNADTIRLIREAIRKTSPDLVVFTGDQIRGYDPAYIDTFLRRRGEHPGARVRAVTLVEAKLQGIHRRLPSQSDGDNDAIPTQHNVTSSPTLNELMDETRAKVRTTFAAFLAPITEAGVPFAATYGNHDFQCGILPDEQDAMYREFPGCLNPAGASSDNSSDSPVNSPSGNRTNNTIADDNDVTSVIPGPEAGTFAIPVAASDGSGRVAMAVTMINSGDYADHDTPAEHDAQYPLYVANSRGLDLADSDGYGTPSPETVDWLSEVQHDLGARNGDGKPVPSIVFQHIPPQEFYDCLKEVPAWTPNAVEGTRTFAGHCYVLDTDKCRPGSRLGEAIGCADENVGEVDAMREAGGYFALFCGHDHKNSFVGHVDGLDLGYAPTCGFACYGPKSRFRGIRLFEFHESAPMAYVTRLLTWGELVGRYSSDELRVWFEDHCITDAVGIRNELRRPQVFAVIAGALSLGFAAAVRAVVRSMRR